MKKGIWSQFFCLLGVFFLIPVFLHGQEGESLRRVTRVLNEIPGRIFSVEERSLLADYGGFGSSLLVSNQTTDGEKPGGTFVFAVPLDAQFAVETALAMAEKLHGSKTNVLIAFLDGEKNELPKDLGGISHRGLRDLLTLTDIPENRVFCYFDSGAVPNELAVWHGIRGYIAPLEIVKPLPSLFSSRNIPWSFKIRFNMIYKLGLLEGPESLSIIWGEETNAFVLSGEANPKKNGKAIMPEELAELLLEYAGLLSFPVVSPDKHYFIISFPNGKVIFVNEWIIVTLFLFAVALFLFLYLLHSARYNAALLFHIRLLAKSFWIILILLLLLVVSFRISRLLYYLFVSVIILNFDRFPMRERFYSFGAVIIIVFGLLASAFMDVSYIPVFLWALLFVFIGSSVSSPIIIFFSALLTPFFAFAALLNLFEANQERFAGLFTISALNAPGSWLAAFQTGVLSLTVLMLIIRGVIRTRILFHRRLKPDRKYGLVLRIITLSVVSLSIVAVCIKPRRNVLSERMEIASGAALNEILTHSLRNIVFQDSRIITLNLAAVGSPIRFDVSIVSRTEKSLLPVYSSPVPLERLDEGKRINLSLGEHPPNPLTLEIVLPLEFEGILETAAIYNAWDSSVDPEGKPESDNYVLRVSKRMDLPMY
jgi:hypothetical protein